MLVCVCVLIMNVGVCACLLITACSVIVKNATVVMWKVLCGTLCFILCFLTFL